MATSASFSPYWKLVGHTEDPFSYVFFIVADINGCPGRPLAVVSSLGSVFHDETLQGSPLLAACHRILTIFGDPSNHAAIRLELNLASAFYADHAQSDHVAEPVLLPEFDRQKPDHRAPLWDANAVYPFPFITSSLVQGVGLDVQFGIPWPAHPEPLGTVYRDSSAEWGMVVFDITDLDAVRYGIVGFPAGPMKYVASPTDEQVSSVASFAGERGDYRVAVDERPRIPTSAAEYAANFREERRSAPDEATLSLLEGKPIIDSTAMSCVWPAEGRAGPAVSRLPLSDDMAQGAAVESSVERALTADGFDESALDIRTNIPGFKQKLRHIVARRLRANPTESTALELIRYAFLEQGHLGLEFLANVPITLLSNLLTSEQALPVTSLSFCIDTVQAAPTQLAKVLSRQDSVRQFFLLQSPAKESDELSARIFVELSRYPELLRRVEITISGAFSSALRAMPWLPRSLIAASPYPVPPYEVYPMQQIFVRSRYASSLPFEYDCFRLSDGLVKPERFVAGLIHYLNMRVMPYADVVGSGQTADQLFSFSTAPASLATAPVESAKISPILAESFAVMTHHRTSTGGSNVTGNLWPVAQPLTPSLWTVVLDIDSCPGRGGEASYIRYAFIRPVRGTIPCEVDEHTKLDTDDMEIAGMKEFLAITAPDVDARLVDRRLQDVLATMTTAGQSALPPGMELISVMSRGDARNALLDSLQKSSKR